MKKLTRKEGGRDRTGREKEGREERRGGGGGRERGVREVREAKEDRKEEELFHLQLTQPSCLFSAASTAPARSRLQTKFAYTHQTTDPYVICDRHVDQPRYDA